MARKFFKSIPEWVFAFLVVIKDMVGTINIGALSGLTADIGNDGRLDYMPLWVPLMVALIDKGITRTLKIYETDSITDKYKE